VLEVTADEFPLWKGDLLVTSLAGQAIHRLRLEGTRVVYDEPISFAGDRLRDIIELPTGRLALLTDRPSVIVLRNADPHSKGPFLDASRQQRRTSDMSAQERFVAVAGRYAKGVDSAAEAAHLTGPASPGERVFQANCASCHSFEAANNAVGPTLYKVVGRRAGSADFAYTDALARRREVWTGHRIVEFALNPTDLYAGTSMKPVSLVPNERRDLESYLDVRGR
jgi:cytochrome c